MKQTRGVSRRPSLELYVDYRCRVQNMSFGHIPASDLARLLANGRLAGVILEYEIASLMGLRHGTQGESSDLISPTIGKIQCKTFRAEPDPQAIVTRGPNAGRRRIEIPTIWTTKSGYWDRQKRMTAADHEDAEAYFHRYDAFMYIDISRMEYGEFSFITIKSEDVIRLKSQYLISEAAIRSLVLRTEELVI